jgi:hypothetical protein
MGWLLPGGPRRARQALKDPALIADVIAGVEFINREKKAAT